MTSSDHDLSSLDGCDVDMTVGTTPDDHIAGVVLFAGVDPEDAETVGDLAESWRALAALADDDEVSDAP